MRPDVGIFLHLQKMGDDRITQEAERFMLVEDTCPMAVVEFARTINKIVRTTETAIRAVRRLQEIGE